MFDPDLKVDSLIDANTRKWNLQAIESLIDPQDHHIIQSIPLSRYSLVDRDGWHFSKSGKYSVKTGYQVERVYPDKGPKESFQGPSVDVLKAHCWKIKCPPKMKHFLWQIVTGCIAVKKNLVSRGLKGEIGCSRCGAAEETVNHVFFECPPAVQVWALSTIPTNLQIFPSEGIFTNMDHLFWRVLPAMEDDQFAWILWYIWKSMNRKIFSNLDIDPRETLRQAEVEARLWKDSQEMLPKTIQREAAPEDRALPNILGRWCFTDASWKENQLYAGQGWYNTLQGYQGLMRARNIRQCLSPLHAEIEALIWAMECMKNLRQTNDTFATDCFQLVKIVYEPEEWPAFASYLQDLKMLKRSFQSSTIIHIPRTMNLIADRLARSARHQPLFVVHMDAEAPEWILEST